jgi:hypothetical protein
MATPALAIRPYVEADEAAVSAIWGAVFPNPAPRNMPRVSIVKKLACQRELFFVALLEGNVVGTTMAGYDGHRGWIYTVAVHPHVQRRGVGRALVHHAEAALVALGCPKINLQVLSSNAKIVGFYERLGYAVEERISMGKSFP